MNILKPAARFDVDCTAPVAQFYGGTGSLLRCRDFPRSIRPHLWYFHDSVLLRWSPLSNPVRGEPQLSRYTTHRHDGSMLRGVVVKEIHPKSSRLHDFVLDKRVPAHSPPSASPHHSFVLSQYCASVGGYIIGRDRSFRVSGVGDKRQNLE
jgi:hypothetical protein